MDKSIAVVVPAYNEERLIFKTLTTIPEFVDLIIAVDDWSNDDTPGEILRAIQQDRKHIRWLRHGENRGVGASIVSGYKMALEFNSDIICVMAGDGQMDPADLEELVTPIAKGEADYAKGNRFVMPLLRVGGGAVLSWLTSHATSYAIKDSQSGYTAINRQVLNKIPLNKIYPRYGMPNDFLIKLSKVGARVVNVPVRAVYGHGERSGIKILRVIPVLLFILGRGLCQRISP